MDKLACQLQRGGRPYKPVVLVSCGSFNPPTNMHLRMFELAKNYLSKVASLLVALPIKNPSSQRWMETDFVCG